MATDSIGGLTDTELLAMASNLWDTINVLPTQYGLTPAYATALDGKRDEFSAELTAHTAAQVAAKAQTVKKDSTRVTLEALIRDARLSAKAAKISEADYTGMGIPSGSSPAPANATVPAAAVDTRERLRHTLSWTDAATLDNRKKPRGTMGAEIWVKIDGAPPGNEADCTFLTLDAFTPYTSEYAPANAGKTAHYMVRWRMRDGSVSAWGETVSATITG